MLRKFATSYFTHPKVNDDYCACVRPVTVVIPELTREYVPERTLGSAQTKETSYFITTYMNRGCVIVLFLPCQMTKLHIPRTKFLETKLYQAIFL